MTQKEFQELKSGLDLLGDRLATLRTRTDARSEAYDLRALRRMCGSFSDLAQQLEKQARLEAESDEPTHTHTHTHRNQAARHGRPGTSGVTTIASC